MGVTQSPSPKTLIPAPAGEPFDAITPPSLLVAKEDEKTDCAARRNHIVISLVMLLLFGTLCVIADVLAHNEKLARSLDDRMLAQYRAHGRPAVRQRNYDNYYDTLMLDELPRAQANFAQDGVYFLGSSNMVFCAEFGDLPPELHSHVFNLGFPWASPGDELLLVRYLTEHAGFLANGQKTHVVVCAISDDLLENDSVWKDTGANLLNYVDQSEFFKYDQTTGITPSPMSSAEKTLRLHRLRMRGFAQRVLHQFGSPPSVHPDPKAFLTEAQRNGGYDWAKVEPRQMGEMRKLLRYLKDHDADVTVMMMPEGTWNDGIPFHEGFMSTLPKACAEMGIAVVDQTHLLADERYMDYHHADVVGADKMRELLVELAQDRLGK